MPSCPPASTPSVVEQVICRGTVFVGDPDTDALDVDRTPPPDAAKFTCTGLDSSFLANCFKILIGPPKLDPSRAGEVNIGVRLRRRGPLNFHRRVSVPLYVCSQEFCSALASLTDERAIEIADNWDLLRNPKGTKSTRPRPPHRARYRATVLVALARVARAALATQKQLMLRVVYRNKRKSASRTGNAAPKKR